jgi:ariadne-1
LSQQDHRIPLQFLSFLYSFAEIIVKNSSNLRQVPDNQEVFVSNTTRTSIIVEITERVERDAWEETDPSSTGGAVQPDNPAEEDAKAVLYHLNDICEGTRDAYEILDAPKYYPIPKINEPTWTAQALVSTRARVPSQMPSGEVQMVEQDVTATIHFFVVRVVEKKADILVHINVPHDELERSGEPDAVVGEELLAHEIMARMTQTIEILDDSLFDNEAS